MEGKKFKFLGIAILMIVSLVAAAISVSAVGVSIDWVKIDGDKFNPGEILEVERDSDIDIKVKISANRDAEDMRIEAFIQGYEHGTIRDESRIFNVEAGEKLSKALKLNLPEEMNKGRYRLRVLVSDAENPALFDERYTIDVDVPRHSLEIEDVAFSPGAEVTAGASLFTTIRIENNGEQDEEVKATVAIPSLGIEATDFIDEIEADETLSSEEMFLRIPRCAQAGTHTAEIKLSYNDGFDEVIEQRTLNIVDGGLCEQADVEKTLITIGTSTAAVRPGEKATFPVTLTNAGSEAKTYSLVVGGAAGWATVEVSPANVLSVKAGESKTAFVYVTPAKEASGKNVFSLNVKAGDDTIKQVSLGLDVASQANSGNWVKGLTIALIIVIIILIIIGIVVAVSKSRSKEDEGEEEGQTYY